MTRYEHFQQKVVPQLKEEFSISHTHAVPRIMKIVMTVGLNRNRADDAFIQVVKENMRRMTGQEPILTRAKRSIASFKIREGQVVGAYVTLRGKRMYHFLEKLIGVALPRVRDFRGLPLSVVDAQGNATIGFREHIVFPEIRSDEVEKIHGLAVVIHTSAGNKEKGMRLLRLIGLPFQEREKETTKPKAGNPKSRTPSPIRHVEETNRHVLHANTEKSMIAFDR